LEKNALKASEVARGVIYLGGQVCYMESKNNMSTFFINDFVSGKKKKKKKKKRKKQN
jgi:hypothetical protein